MATLYFVTDDDTQRELRNAYRAGKLFRIRKGIYIDTDNEGIKNKTIFSQWYRIAQFLFKGSIAAFRTADELRPVNGRIYLLAEGLKRRTVKVGPVEFIVDTGNTNVGVEPFQPEMMRSNPARLLLENLSPSRAKVEIKKTLGKDWVEAQLVQEIERRGENGVNQLRDEARVIADTLNYKDEFDVLNKMILALLKKHHGVISHPLRVIFQIILKELSLRLMKLKRLLFLGKKTMNDMKTVMIFCLMLLFQAIIQRCVIHQTLPKH